MDLSKYPLEKLLHYLAGVIPGIAALLMLEAATPGVLGSLFSVGFLGYRAKIVLVLLLAFVIGNTLSISLSFILTVPLIAMGTITYAIRSRSTYQDRHAYDAAPWRDARWRALAKQHLGDRAPNDTLLDPRKGFDLRRKFQEILPEKLRTVSLAEMDAERNRLEVDDANWAAWYDHFHQLIIQEEDRSFDSYVKKGLTFNFEATAAFILVSAIFVPPVRHWWVIVPACVWILFLILETFAEYVKRLNGWSTFISQIKYLSDNLTVHGQGKVAQG